MIIRNDYMEDSTKNFQKYFYTSKEDYSKNASEIHYKYFGQFVNNSIISTVKNFIELNIPIYKGIENIPLSKWDAMAPLLNTMISRKLLKEAGEILSLSTTVCIAKTALKNIQDNT